MLKAGKALAVGDNLAPSNSLPGGVIEDFRPQSSADQVPPLPADATVEMKRRHSLDGVRYPLTVAVLLGGTWHALSAEGVFEVIVADDDAAA